MRKKSIYEFIEQAQAIHNNKYTYDCVLLENLRSKIEITCKIHGNFYQQASEHLRGYGCRKCGGCSLKSLEDFTNKANIIHKNKYSYMKSEYKNNITNIIITCPIHGDFLQLPKTHLKGAGCHSCNGGIKLTIYDFIEKASKIHHNKYNYSESIYKNSKTKIKILCNEHGQFYQIPNDHLQGANCPRCTRLGRTSIKEQKWLDSLNISHEYRNFQILINNKFLYVDGYDPITNTVYEFYGDFWHGNPKIYDQYDINLINKKSYGQLYLDTINRQNILIEAGYTLKYIWETDYDKNIFK